MQLLCSNYIIATCSIHELTMHAHVIYITLVLSSEAGCALSWVPCACPAADFRGASAHVLQARGEHLPDAFGARELCGADDEPMLRVLRHQLAQLAQLAKGDAPDDKENDRPVVREARLGADAEEVGAAREERADGGRDAMQLAEVVAARERAPGLVGSSASTGESARASAASTPRVYASAFPPCSKDGAAADDEAATSCAATSCAARGVRARHCASSAGSHP